MAISLGLLFAQGVVVAALAMVATVLLLYGGILALMPRYSDSLAFAEPEAAVAIMRPGELPRG
jgi:hypothetical protein